MSKYQDSESLQLGADIIKLTNDFNKEIISYAEKNKIEYIAFEVVSTKELKQTTDFVDNMFKTIEENNPEFFNGLLMKKFLLNPHLMQKIF